MDDQKTRLLSINEAQKTEKSRSVSKWLIPIIGVLFVAAVVLALVFTVANTTSVSHKSAADGKARYMQEREALLEKDRATRIGADLVLNDQEAKLNAFLLKEKRELMENARLNGTVYTPALSFYVSRPWMENTDIFKVIKKMPKGAALHLHDLALTSLDWLVKNATYRDHVYSCVKQNYTYLRVNKPSDPDCDWQLIKEQREESGDPEAFDQRLIKNISYLGTDPLEPRKSITELWGRFNTYFMQIKDLVFYTPILRDYYLQGLKEFMEDNVQYIELRSLLSGFFDLNGTTHDEDFGVDVFKRATDTFVKDNPGFTGAKIIFSQLRFVPVETIQDDLFTTTALMKKYPGFLLGYDLVGQEDPNKSILDYIDAFLNPKIQPGSVPYFFHAAETNWQGTAVDYNLIDAIALNTRRIGHGFGLVKHPELVDEVKKRGIAVEINPISNQILGLVDDLRNHALAPLLADNLPLVISSDDPGAWEALPLTHDFYVAFMNLCGEDDGLKFLKQLAINSIKYSAMSEKEKTRALDSWQEKWDTFVDEAVRDLNLK